MKPCRDTKCLDAALRLLARRDHSVAELNRKLSQRGFAPDQIASVIAECERMHYLDDARFCQMLTLQQRRRGYGILRIAQMLRTKGLNAHQIDESLSRDCSETNQIEDCRRVLTKKLRSCSATDAGNRTERLYRFLLSRGFTSATIFQVLDEEIPGSCAQ
jgi:regulatory protein